LAIFFKLRTAPSKQQKCSAHNYWTILAVFFPFAQTENSILSSQFLVLIITCHFWYTFLFNYYWTWRQQQELGMHIILAINFFFQVFGFIQTGLAGDSAKYSER